VIRMSQSSRTHPAYASIVLAVRKDSHRHFFVHEDGLFSTVAMDANQALELAVDEFPEDDREDFELVTDFCRHGRPKTNLGWHGECLDCRQERAERQRAGLRWLDAGGADSA